MPSLPGRPFARALRAMLGTPLVQSVAVTTIAVAVGVLAVLLTLQVNLTAAAARFSEEARLVAQLAPGASPAQLQTAHAFVAQWPEVAAVRMVTAEAALAELVAVLGDDAPPVEDADLVPASLEVTLVPVRRDAAGLEAVAARLRAVPGVEAVDAGLDLFGRFDGARRAVTWVGAVVAALALLAVIFIVGNTVRLALYARRDELAIMDLVGATHAFIRGPYYVEGALQGGLGAGLAVLGLWGLLAALLPADRTVGFDFLTHRVVWPPASWWAALVGGTAAVGLLASHLATTRFLRRRP